MHALPIVIGIVVTRRSAFSARWACSRDCASAPHVPVRCTSALYTRETRNSAIAEGPRDASCQLKSCQLLARNSAETTCTTSPEQIEVMKFEGYRAGMCIKHVHSTVTRSSRF